MPCPPPFILLNHTYCKHVCGHQHSSTAGSSAPVLHHSVVAPTAGLWAGEWGMKEWGGNLLGEEWTKGQVRGVAGKGGTGLVELSFGRSRALCWVYQHLDSTASKSFLQNQVALLLGYFSYLAERNKSKRLILAYVCGQLLFKDSGIQVSLCPFSPPPEVYYILRNPISTLNSTGL